MTQWENGSLEVNLVSERLGKSSLGDEVNLVSERLGTRNPEESGGESGKRKVGNKEPRRRDLGKTGAW